MDAEVLRQMLTERRAAIKPESLGLIRLDPRGRKSPGLTQAQMDDLLLRAPGTYGKLERGVLDNPTPEYLRDVAEILGLTEEEWVVFYGYARGEQPPYPLTRDGEVRVPAHWMQTMNAFSGISYLCDLEWNVLAYNEAFAAIFPGRRAPHNTMHWMLFSDDARERVLGDWEKSWAPLVAPQLRAALAQDENNRTLRALAEQCLGDPRTRDLYTSIRPGHAHPDGAERPLHHTELGPGWVTVSVCEPVGSRGTRLYHLLFRPEGAPRPSALPGRWPVAGRDPASFFPDPSARSQKQAGHSHHAPWQATAKKPGPKAVSSPGAPDPGGSS